MLVACKKVSKVNFCRKSSKKGDNIEILCSHCGKKKQKKQTKKKTWGAYVPTYLRGTSKKITRRELITKRERGRVSFLSF